MRFRFDETMRGTWREVRPGGHAGTFEFSCRAEVEGMVRFAGDRTARLTGNATLDGVGTGPLEGSVRIDPLLGREVAYDFTFRIGASRFHFLGRKTVRLRAPWTSMTTLPGTIERDGVTYGQADLRFLVRDLPAMLASFRVAP